MVHKKLVLRSSAALDSKKIGDVMRGAVVLVLDEELIDGVVRCFIGKESISASSSSACVHDLGWVTAFKEGELMRVPACLELSDSQPPTLSLPLSAWITLGCSCVCYTQARPIARAGQRFAQAADPARGEFRGRADGWDGSWNGSQLLSAECADVHRFNATQQPAADSAATRQSTLTHQPAAHSTKHGSGQHGSANSKAAAGPRQGAAAEALHNPNQR